MIFPIRAPHLSLRIYTYIYIYFCFYILYTHPGCPGEIWLSRAAEVEGGFLLPPGLQILSAVPGGHEEGSVTGLRVDMLRKAGISTVNVQCLVGIWLIGACCDELMKSDWIVKFVQQNESKPCFDRLGPMWNGNSMCLMYGFTKAMSQKHGFPRCTATIIDVLCVLLALLLWCLVAATLLFRYWVYALEDALDIIAKIPSIAAKIYRRTFADGVVPEWTGI